MKKMMMVMVATVIGLFITGSVFAWGGHGGYGKDSKDSPRAKAMKEEMKKELGITPEQEKLLDAQREACSKEGDTFRKDMKSKKDELKDAISKPGVTRAQVEPIVAELKALEAQKIDRRVNSILAIKAILTPEQFAKLEAMKEKHMKEWKEKHKDRGGKGPVGQDGPKE